MTTVHSGGTYMFFLDVGGQPGVFTVADNEVSGIETIRGSNIGGNWFLLQGMQTAMTLYGGAFDDVFFTTFAFADTIYGRGGNDTN